MNCKNCGARMEHTDKACAYCGSFPKPLKDALEVAAVAVKGVGDTMNSAAASRETSAGSELKKLINPEAFYEKPAYSVKPEVYRPQQQTGNHSTTILVVVLILLFLFFSI
jgi:hypothetical protein